VGSEPFGKFSTLLDSSAAYKNLDLSRQDRFCRVLNMELLQFCYSGIAAFAGRRIAATLTKGADVAPGTCTANIPTHSAEQPEKIVEIRLVTTDLTCEMGDESDCILLGRLSREILKPFASQNAKNVQLIDGVVSVMEDMCPLKRKRPKLLRVRGAFVEQPSPPSAARFQGSLL